MCKKYKLLSKRPHEKVFTDWCSTDDYELVQRNIKVIEGYGWQWKLIDRQFEYGCVTCKDREVCEANPFGICKKFERRGGL